MLAPPTDESAILAAIDWLAQSATGTIATTIGVLALAGWGIATVLGHARPQRLVSIVLGLFLLFGAQTIATGLLTATAGATQTADPAEAIALTPELPRTPPTDTPRSICWNCR